MALFIGFFFVLHARTWFWISNPENALGLKKKKSSIITNVLFISQEPVLKKKNMLTVIFFIDFSMKTEQTTLALIRG